MIKLNNIDQYLLGNIFTTEQPTGETPAEPDTSLFTDVQNLFSEGMTEEDFISKYEQIVAGNVFDLEADESTGEIDLSSIASKFLDSIKEIASKYFNFVDKDHNGVISKEEMTTLASIDGDETSISEDDIASITSEIFPDSQKIADSTDVIRPTTYSPGSGGSGGVYNTKKNDDKSSSTQTMTLEQLQQQRNNKQGDLDSARGNLKTIYEQGNKNVNSAKNTYNTAVQNDEQISDELKEQNAKISESYSAKEQELGSLKSNLVEVNATIANCNSIIDAKKSDIAALNAALNNLDPEKSDTTQKKSEIEGKISEAENAKSDAEQKLADATRQQGELEGKISTAQTELDALGTQKLKVENMIEQAGSQATKEALSAYREAQTKADEAIKAAEANVVSLQEEIDTLDKQINAKQSSRIQADYRQTKLNKTYTLNGEEYMSLFSQEELDAFLRGEYARGNYNHDSNCLEMSYVYSKDIMKQLGLSGSCTDFSDDSQEAVEQRAREALDNGYPVIMHVSTQRGTRHFATAVGYRVTDEGKLVFLLADNVQGVGITACGEGERRHMITGYSTPYKNQNYGFRCLYYS